MLVGIFSPILGLTYGEIVLNENLCFSNFFGSHDKEVISAYSCKVKFDGAKTIHFHVVHTL